MTAQNRYGFRVGSRMRRGLSTAVPIPTLARPKNCRRVPAKRGGELLRSIKGNVGIQIVAQFRLH